MGYRERMLEALTERDAPVCDDCVSEIVGMKYRQQAYSRGQQLEALGAVRRGQGSCSVCGKLKTVSAPTGVELPKGAEPVRSADKPWFWEGNVQAVLVGHLVEAGWVLVSQANTATKETGVDIVARDPEERLWWISVKGYPEETPGKKTRPATQARHWFSSAMFDVSTYRTKSEDVMIGVALPGPFRTYMRLKEQSNWLQDAAGFVYFIVEENGDVTEIEPRVY